MVEGLHGGARDIRIAGTIIFGIEKTRFEDLLLVCFMGIRGKVPTLLAAGSDPVQQRIAVDDMYTMSPNGLYWFKNGWNPNAVMTMAATGVVAILLSLFTSIGDFGWFIGCGLGFAVYLLLATRGKLAVTPIP